MRKIKQTIWYTTFFLALFFAIITFTPIITPQYIYTPRIFGMPYTLWSGLLISILMVLNTWLATIVHPGDKNK